jgi:multicomponent Na+:H+ antiporter subunit C
MELLLPLLAGLLIGAGVYLVMARALIRMIVGLSMISYGVNLSILLAGAGTEQKSPPLLNLPGPYTDPVPQALILTAIVIGFGTTALLLVLSLKAYQVTRTDHVQELTERPDPPLTPIGYADPEQPSVSPEEGAPGDLQEGDDRAGPGLMTGVKL